MKKPQELPEPETCPICHKEMEDRRHVGVECFYDVSEAVPETRKLPIFKEVDRKSTIWGITRHYPRGTRDKWFIKKVSVSKEGIKTTHSGIKQVPVKAVRLLEDHLYSVTCCKACRGDFLRLFGQWAKGKFVTPEGDGDIPVRELGAIKMLTRGEWESRNKKRTNVAT
jgi:hypothetical protein